MPGYGGTYDGTENLSNIPAPAQGTRRPRPEPDAPVTRGSIVMRFAASLLATLVGSAVLVAILVISYCNIPAAASTGMGFFLLVIGLGCLFIIWSGLHQRFRYEAWQVWEEKKNLLQPAWPEIPQLGLFPAQDLLNAATGKERHAAWYRRHMRMAADIEQARIAFMAAWAKLEAEEARWERYKPERRWGSVFYPDWRRESDEWSLHMLAEEMAGKAMRVEETGKALVARQEEFRASLEA